MIDMEPDVNPVVTALQQDLVEWVRSNPKTCDNITGQNSKQMFLFDHKNCLTINLNRFNQDYYRQVFIMNNYKRNRKAFVDKACMVMRDTLIRIKKYDITLTINLRYWNTTETTMVYIHPRFKESPPAL